MRKLYRRTMRTVARFILGFDNCPVDCKRDLKKQVETVATVVLLTLVFMVVFAWFIVTTM